MFNYMILYYIIPDYRMLSYMMLYFMIRCHFIPQYVTLCKIMLYMSFLVGSAVATGIGHGKEFS